MFYKKDENGKWWEAMKIALPSGEILSTENKKSLDGWEWHDEPPQEYVEWLSDQDDISN
jgi:hypothetical protein